MQRGTSRVRGPCAEPLWTVRGGPYAGAACSSFRQRGPLPHSRHPDRASPGEGRSPTVGRASGGIPSSSPGGGRRRIGLGGWRTKGSLGYVAGCRQATLLGMTWRGGRVGAIARRALRTRGGRTRGLWGCGRGAGVGWVRQRAERFEPAGDRTRGPWGCRRGAGIEWVRRDARRARRGSGRQQGAAAEGLNAYPSPPTTHPTRRRCPVPRARCLRRWCLRRRCLRRRCPSRQRRPRGAPAPSAVAGAPRRG